MANQEHLAILKQGVEVWNEWRQENPDTEPDLSGADITTIDFPLAGITAWRDLVGVNFERANLSEVNLSDFSLASATLIEANLRGAKLERTDLDQANLRVADLRHASLREASGAGVDCGWAKLRGADLTDSWLANVSFAEADLADAVFTNVSISSAVFGNVDLSSTKHLHTVRHDGPSYIDINTIYRSKGNIPEAFLRGAGVPDTFIKFARSLALAERPIDYYSCFISYSSDDEDFVQRLHADLQNNGVRCWFAPEDMKIGDKIRQRIDESIRIHDKLLLVLSDNSIDSQWVEKEVETAWEEERRRGETVLFPVRLDDSVFETNQAWAADVRRQRHIGDFREWKSHDAYQEAFERLLRDLKAAQ